MISYGYQEHITMFTSENGRQFIRRIMAASEDTVKLVEFGWVAKDKCSLPLNVGDKVFCLNGTHEVTAIPETEDGFSFEACKRFTIESGTELQLVVEGTRLSFTRILDNSDTCELESPIFKQMTAFLGEVGYNYSNNVVADIVNKAYSAKEKLRDKFRKSEFWNEDLQALIVPDFTFTSEPNYSDVSTWINEIFRQSRKFYPDSVLRIAKNAVNSHLYKNHVYLNDYDACALEQGIENYKYPHGAKVTKFLRGIFDGLNLGEHNSDYERHFAMLADSASPKEHKRLLVISLNVMDFLTMSEGNSWKSCHNIRERGCYHGGCLSYALDEVTAILYTLPADTDISNGELWKIQKINRQLFMFGDSYVVESRLYPNCEALHIRKAHHDIVNKIYTKIMEKRFNPVKGSYERIAQNVCDHVNTHGLHYPDYHYNCYYITALISDDYENEKLTIGSDVPDIVTGEINQQHDSMTTEGGRSGGSSVWYEDASHGYSITDADEVEYFRGEVYHHEYCYWSDEEDCYIPDDIAIYINDDYYSPEYVEKNFVECSKCGEYVRNDRAVWCDDEPYCPSCADSYLTTCDECGEYVHRSDVEYVDDKCICPDCIETKTRVCTVCGERHFNQYFNTDLTVCIDCAEEHIKYSLPESGVVVVHNRIELKKFIASAHDNGLKWKNGEPANDGYTVDVMRRTLMNPRITALGIIIGETLMYAPEADGLPIPDIFGERIQFSELPVKTTENVNA